MSRSKQSFEDQRWRLSDQKLTYRHRAGLRQLNLNGFGGEPHSVLDVGCGDGRFLELLSEHGYESPTGVDISPEGVQQTKDKGFCAHTVDIEHEQLPFADDTFEVATLLDVVEHLHDPSTALKEVARVASNVIVIVPNFNSLTARYRVLRGEIPAQNKPEKGHVNWLNRREIHRLLSDVGVEVKNEDYYIYKQNSKLGPLTRFVGQIRPELFATAFTIVGSTA